MSNEERTQDRGDRSPQPRPRVWLLALALALVGPAGWTGCDEAGAPAGGGTDLGRDAGHVVDGGGRPDGGENPVDAGDLGPARRDGGPGEPDLGPADAGPLDGGACPGGRDFAQSCCHDGDCLGGWCVQGEQGPVCSRTCNDDCPEGWDCREILNEGGDAAFVCLFHPVLCQPCLTSAECGDAANLCLAIGDGTFCARPCRQAGDCPAGYDCQDATAQGAPAGERQCLPSGGWCTACRDEDHDAHRGGPECAESLDCNDGDPAIYRGAEERCNGRDDDCDGQTDEDFRFSSDVRNCGSCGRTCALPHTLVACVQGGCVTEGCEAPYHDRDPAQPGCEYFCPDELAGGEICDERDNDCDGQTDEDFDLRADPAHCGRCDVSCPVGDCRQQGDGYVARGDARCVESRCEPAETFSCGLYTCLGGDIGSRCGRTCHDDSQCAGAAHCALGACVADVVDGAPCTADNECATGHCGNGFCCAAGDCCASPSDCPAAVYREPARCTLPSACQGSRVDAVCSAEHRCGSLPADDDSACDAGVLADECGFGLPLFCTGEALQDDLPCADRCSTDEQCDLGAHCDGSCRPDVEDGGACDEASDCTTGHCANGFCCGAGDCCAVAADCPASYGERPRCVDAARCQGGRIDPLCTPEHECVPLPLDDDSGCGATLVADDCGLFTPALCRGLPDQLPPVCPAQCDGDAGCDASAHCSDGLCVADLAPGAACTRDGDCGGGHCGNGFCCAAGDCCAVAADCPGAYFEAPSCTLPTLCQGGRVDARCEADHRCGVQPVDDDSACSAQVVAAECGLYQPLHCTGALAQQASTCPTRCDVDAQCDPGAHCDGTCQPNLDAGGACDEASDCWSGHCQNRFCCQAGDCCQVAADCPAAQYAVEPVCDSPATCQGHRQDASCSNNSCGRTGTLDDDRGCSAALLSDGCGYYPAVRCTGAADQADPACAEGCASDADCDANGHCAAGRCLADLLAGGPCGGPSDCQEGLACVDGACCSSLSCGACQRCDLSGNGNCSSIPAGADPDGECGALSCDGWYWGWSGSACYERADATAAQVACNGGGGCQGAAAICPLTGQGVPVLQCHATCQQPLAGSCSGNTVGACVNVNPGTVSCGVGECRRTVPQCVGGAPNSCTPGTSVGESCNGLDDDCDGQVDDNLGSTSCGLGVCLHTVSNCVNGLPQTCDPLQGAQASDTPELGYVDSNCDGLDGDRSRAVFVSLAGSDASSGLSSGAPKRTIQAAIALAASRTPKFDVLVSAGTYSENITLAPGVSLYGGYHPQNWSRDVTAQATVLQGSGPRALTASGITVATRVQGLTIQGASFIDGGQSSYAVWVGSTPTAGLLTFERCPIKAGTGGRGLDGTDGAGGSSGSRGNDGSGGSGGGGGWSSCGARGGDGGSAWVCGNSGGAGGTNGGGSTAVGGGGAAGANHCGGCNDIGEPATGGGSGGNGSPGSGGTGAAGASGSLSGGYWSGSSGGAGNRGAHGGGGGGGGAGGSDEDPWYCIAVWSDSAGGAGGGGGAGGCGGNGAGGGGAGGASIAVLLLDSRATFDACPITLGQGGTGGRGGAGGGGGGGGIAGSPGSSSNNEGGPGATGGAGGAGGQGGGGGGGCGGPAIGIATQGAAGATLGGGTGFSGGAGGGGGAGGAGGAPAAGVGCTGSRDTTRAY